MSVEGCVEGGRGVTHRVQWIIHIDVVLTKNVCISLKRVSAAVGLDEGRGVRNGQGKVVWFVWCGVACFLQAGSICEVCVYLSTFCRSFVWCEMACGKHDAFGFEPSGTPSRLHPSKIQREQ